MELAKRGQKKTSKRDARVGVSKSEEQILLKRLVHRLSSTASVPHFDAAVNRISERTLKDRVAEFVESVPFNVFIILVVLFDFILFILEANKSTYDDIGRTAALVISIVVAIIFTLEMVLKIFIYGTGMIENTWNVVDLTIWVITVAGVGVEIAYGARDERRAGDSLTQSIADFCDGVLAIRLVRVIRLVRLVHIMRAIRHATMLGTFHSQGDVRLPILVCLDILTRAISVLQESGVREFVEGMISIEDVKWIVSVLQSERLYFPDVQMDDALPEEVKQLLGGGAAFTGANAAAPPRFGLDECETPDVAVLLGIPSSPDLTSVTSDLFSWNLDVFRLKDATRNMPLSFLAINYFHSLGLVQHFSLDVQALIHWVRRVESDYCISVDEGLNFEGKTRAGVSPSITAQRTDAESGQFATDSPDNPYHNNVRAAATLANIAYFLRAGQLIESLTPLETLALAVAAIMHDFKHPGVTTSFLKRSGHAIALKFNDEGVLANHHVSNAFALMRESGLNPFSGLSKGDYAKFRQLVINLMLGSGTSDHYGLLTKLSVKLMGQEVGLDTTKEEDRVLVMRTVLYTSSVVADAAKEKSLFDKYFTKLMDEFYRQGDLEKELGMEVSLFMNRADGEAAKYQCQLGYVNIVSLPMLDVVFEFLRQQRKDGANDAMANCILGYARSNRDEVRAVQAKLRRKSRRSLGAT
eukprot:c52839_g1_i1.p1 GENE.c52839_g1_i1~~c52839_g1_i1.p1  ORF type:complete len:697 (+),score=148.86 c52839_g1_i1:72-2162(+)